jgi:hypothetical protein
MQNAHSYLALSLSFGLFIDATVSAAQFLHSLSLSLSLQASLADPKTSNRKSEPSGLDTQIESLPLLRQEEGRTVR